MCEGGFDFVRIADRFDDGDAAIGGIDQRLVWNTNGISPRAGGCGVLWGLLDPNSDVLLDCVSASDFESLGDLRLAEVGCGASRASEGFALGQFSSWRSHSCCDLSTFD